MENNFGATQNPLITTIYLKVPFALEIAIVLLAFPQEAAWITDPTSPIPFLANRPHSPFESPQVKISSSTHNKLLVSILHFLQTLSPPNTSIADPQLQS